jgi:hypothetical protein
MPRDGDALSRDWCGGPAGQNCTERGSLSQPPLDSANRFAASGLHVTRLRLSLECHAVNPVPDPQCVPDSRLAMLRVYSSRVELEDLAPPIYVESVRGTLLNSSAPLAGEKTVTLHARDYGGGVARMGLVIDGQGFAEQSVDPTDSRCRIPFTSLVPCPLEIARTLAFDTALLGNGTHSVRVMVEDAAGNRTLSDPVTVTTRNGGQPNGKGATRFARLQTWFEDAGRSERTVSFGRTRSIAGRLTDAAGHAIGGAQLQVMSRDRRPGARWRSARSTTTSEKGRFRFGPRSGASRVFRFEYRAFTLDDLPAATADATLNVRAGVTLRVRPRNVRAFGQIKLSGRLRGGPGRRGVQVQLFAVALRGRDRVPGATVRVARNGGFQFRYRFRRTVAPATFPFQAVVEEQSG